MSIKNHKRGGSTIKNHGKTERQKKKSITYPSSSSSNLGLEEEPKIQSQGKPDNPGDRLAILAAK